MRYFYTVELLKLCLLRICELFELLFDDNKGESHSKEDTLFEVQIKGVFRLLVVSFR